MAYDNNNSGALFKHDKQHDKQPDYKGYIEYEYNRIQLAGWIRESKKTGQKFISLKVDTYNPAEEAREDKIREVAHETLDGMRDSGMNLDNIPFNLNR